MVQGIEPQDYLRQVAAQLENLETQQQIETVLDELEFLFDVIDPELQDNAGELIARLRSKLRAGP